MAEAAKASRATSKRLFTRAENALHQALEAKALEETVRRRFDDYRRRWDNVQEVHDNYIERLGDIAEEELAVEDQWLDELSERFYNLEMRVDAEIDERKKIELEAEKQIKQETELKIAKEVANVKADKHEPRSNTIQLERMKFSTFDGDIRKYPKFKEEFMTHIRPICNLSQLPFVLKSYLSEKVKAEVENVAETCDAIFKRLDEKYGDKGMLIDSIMADIKHLKGCADNNDEDTLHLINTVEKAHRDLLRLREEEQMNNAAIISMIEQKLPEKIFSEWIKEISTKTVAHRSRFQSLMKLLEEWRKRIEYRLASIRYKTPEHSGQVNHGRGFQRSDDFNSNERQNCWLHGSAGEHAIWKCKLFLSKPVEERISLTNLYKACSLCLDRGHSVDECPKPFKCSENGCGQRHNKLLHVERASGSVNQADGNQPTQTILPIQEL